MQGLTPQSAAQGWQDPSLVQSSKQKFSNPELIQLAINCLDRTLGHTAFGNCPELSTVDYSSKLHFIYNQLKQLNEQ